MGGTELADLAAWAEARLPRLIDDACAAVVDRVPMYRGDHSVRAAELRRSVENNLRVLVAAIGRPGAPLDLAAPRETGRRRAHQGAPLPEVLQAYRLGFATLWDALVDHIRRSARPGLRDALLDIASLIWRLTDEHALALTEAYRAATAELLLSQQRPGPEAGPWEAAALLGLPLDGHLVVAAAGTHGLAEESLPGIEHRLPEHGIVSGWRLSPAQQLGIISLHADQRDTVLGVLGETATARAGISPLYRSLTDTPRSAPGTGGTC